MLATDDDQELTRAYSLHQRGNLNEAAILYRQLINRNSDNFHALHYLGVIEASIGNFEQAKLLMARSLSIQPPNLLFVENYATILCQTEDYESALQFSKRGLQLNNNSTSLLYVSAISLFKLDKLQEALTQFDRLLSLQPKHVAALNERASVLAATKQYDAALVSVEKALVLHPNYAEAHLNKGNLYGELKHYDQAIAAYDKALALRPDLANAWLGRGNVFRALKRLDEAIAAYEKALVLSPNLASAWLGCGKVSYELKRYDESLVAYDKVLALQPDLAEAWLGRGNVFYELKRNDESLAAYEKALVQSPTLANAWLGRGNVFCGLKRYDESLATYDKALALKPNLAEAWLGRGNVSYELKRNDESLAAYDKALALEPDLAEAWLGRGNIFDTWERDDEALAAYDRAIALKPDIAEAWHGRGKALFKTNQLTEAFAAFDQALSIRPNYSAAISARIFVLDFKSDAGFEEQQKARNYWWQQVGSAIAERSRMHHLNTRNPDRRIKVGYASADFRVHSAARCIRPMLFNHDKSRFEITCYSSSHIEDELTKDFQRVADRWRNVAQSSDDELCEQVQADQIDILVDLSGHTAGHRLGAFARKPAPVQVTTAGSNGTGLPTFDYLFSDPVACPQPVRHLFAEKVFDLPCIMTIEALPFDLSPSNPPVLTKGYVTFGVFNRASKISDDVVSLWAAILRSVPRSQLLMKHYAFDEASMRSRQWERFATQGIAAERIVLLGGTSREDHLAAFKDVDISLDTFPHNGGISTLESLQMGVPVVALLGNSISSRAAGAILTSIGMADWVADSADQYLSIAVKFAALPDRLKALRDELPTNVAASAVGNGAIYTEAIEAAYRTMWADYCRTAR